MNSKALAAEMIGTFTLTFIGAGAGALAASSGSGLLGVALAHGVALMVIVYAWGAVSGAHVNPAVTFGLAVAGKMKWGDAVSYWFAQCLGAIVAAFALAWLVGTASGLGATTGSLTASSPIKTVVVEAILTFFLVTAVFANALDARNGNAAGLGIGLVLTMDILMGGPLTGGSMNPARTLGPALVTGDLSYLWMYVVGPFAGAAAAAGVYGAVAARPRASRAERAGREPRPDEA